jgi:hypothetical protein
MYMHQGKPVMYDVLSLQKSKVNFIAIVLVVSLGPGHDNIKLIQRSQTSHNIVRIIWIS